VRPYPSALRIFLKSVIARSYPRVIGGWRNRTWLFLEVVLPLLGTIAMVYVYRALAAPREYLGFVVMGGVAMAFWNNTLWNMAVQFYWDRDGGNLELYAAAPTSFIAILLGMAMGGIYMTVFRAGVILAVGSLLFGVSYDAGQLAPALAVFLVTLGALYGLGMTLASLFLFYGREAWHLGNAMQEPVSLLSGFYFPVRALGGYVGGAASLIPLTLGLDAIRQLLLPATQRFIPVEWEAVALALQIVLYGILAHRFLMILEWRARRDGRLIARWT